MNSLPENLRNSSLTFYAFKQFLESCTIFIINKISRALTRMNYGTDHRPAEVLVEASRSLAGARNDDGV